MIDIFIVGKENLMDVWVVPFWSSSPLMTVLNLQFVRIECRAYKVLKDI